MRRLGAIERASSREDTQITPRNEARRREYLLDLCAAVAAYLEAGGSLRIESERSDEELQITLRVADPEAFHARFHDALLRHVRRDSHEM